MERLSMRKIKDVMRLGSQGLSARKIAVSLGISRGAVAAYADRAQAAGLTWPLPVELTEGDLESLLFPASVQVLSATFPQPDWAQVHIELRRKGVTLALLWEEYRGINHEGYGYSRYCELYRRWEGHLSPVMRQHHVAGERLFVDYAGATLDVVCATNRRDTVDAGLRRHVGRIQLHLCRGDLDAKPARLDCLACPRLRVLWGRPCAGGLGQSEIGRDQGVLL